MSEYNEWEEAGYCIMALVLIFVLYLLPSIMGWSI